MRLPHCCFWFPTMHMLRMGPAADSGSDVDAVAAAARAARRLDPPEVCLVLGLVGSSATWTQTGRSCPASACERSGSVVDEPAPTMPNR